LIAREIWRIVSDIPRARHRNADRRQELPRRHGDRRPQRDLGEGAGRVRGHQPGAPRPAGGFAPASRRVGKLRCLSSLSRRSGSRFGASASRDPAGRHSSSCTRDSGPSRCGAAFLRRSRARRD
jgi:hypothetical protein